MSTIRKALTVAAAILRQGFCFFCDSGPCYFEKIITLCVSDGPFAQKKARQALQSAGARVTGEQDALVLEIEDKPGALGKLTRKIADAGVNLNAVYLATKTRVVIGAADIEKARAAAGEGAASRR